MIAVKEYFENWKSINQRWSYTMPWGTPNGMNGVFSSSASFELIGNGLKINCIWEEVINGWLMPRLFWKGAPMGFGKYTAWMTVPPQTAVIDFTLYSNVTYMKGIRTILPEIDVAEYGIPHHPDKLNVAVHRWKKPPYFLSHPDYKTEDRHKLDYMGHKTKNKILTWDNSPHKHSCEITPSKIRILVDDEVVLTQCGKNHITGFNPTFGMSIPLWMAKPPGYGTIYAIIYRFELEQ